MNKMSTEPNRVIEVFPKKEQLMSVKLNVPCTIEGCCKEFTHEGMLKMHLVKSHASLCSENDKRLFHQTKKKSNDISYIFFCPEQGCKYSCQIRKKHFSSFHLLKQHFMKLHAEKRFFCKKCGSGYSVERFLRHHEDQCGNLYTCATCPVYYTTRAALQTHCKRHKHTYPEEYRKKDKEKEEKQKPKERSDSADVSEPHVTSAPVYPSRAPVYTPGAPVYPVALIAVIRQDPACSSIRPYILPKLSFPVGPTINRTGKKGGYGISATVTGSLSQTGISNRKEVMTQTDIYGIDSLSFNGKSQSALGGKGANHDMLKGYGALGTYSSDALLKTNSVMQTNKIFASPSSPKGRSKSVKRRASNSRSGTPRRKRPRTTTGIQTSVSLTQKKRTRVVSVSGTQTTGDLILKKAMAEADIPIKKRTVGSQVTPQKANKIVSKANVGTDMVVGKVNVGTDTCIGKANVGTDMVFHQVNDTFVGKANVGTSMFNENLDGIINRQMQARNGSFHAESEQGKPLLVDSFSQVQPRNIIAETLENMAESQTMTDLPESISTQTLHSYLVNMQDRKSPIRPQIGPDPPPYKDNFSRISFNDGQGSNGNIQKYDTMVPTEKITKDSTVEIYNSRLEKSLTIHVPFQESTKAKHSSSDLNQRRTCLEQIRSNGTCLSYQNELQNTVSSLGNTNEVESQADTCNVSVGTNLPSKHNDKNLNDCLSTQVSRSDKTSHITNERISSREDIDKGGVSTDTTGSTIDTEVQTMSTQEFEKLLQSSGIHLQVTGLSEHWTTPAQPPKESREIFIETDFNVFEANADTIDMNTQTVSDLDLFNDIGAIDMNTQTTDNDLDFLDLVMNNMQTQTLNEDDLTSLGLSSKGGNPINLHPNVHSLGVDTRDFPMISKATSPRIGSDHGHGYTFEAATQSLGIGTSDFELDTHFKSDDILFSNFDGVQAYSNQNSRHKYTVPKTGLQVTRNDGVKQSVQTETETQTTGEETGDRLVQTEMQTQVDSNDIEFEVTNMQTQTTFEEFCDWLM